MKHQMTSLAALTLMLMVGSRSVIAQQGSSASSQQAQQLQSLRELHDNGLLSDDEYRAKLQALNPSTPGPTAVSPPQIAVRIAEIPDPSLGMKAALVRLPADWKFSGEVSRRAGCTSKGPAIKYTAQSADGKTGFEMYPAFAWNWFESNPRMAEGARQRGCAVLPINTAADFLNRIVLPKLRPGAQLIEMLQLGPQGQAKLKEQLLQLHESSVRMGASYGMSPEKSLQVSDDLLDGARAHIVYTRGGQSVEEIIRAVVHCNVGHHAGNRFVNQPPWMEASCWTQSLNLARVPQGQWESMQPVMSKVALMVNPDWDQKIAQISAQQFKASEDAEKRWFNSLMAQSEIEANNRTAAWAAGERARQISVDRSIAEDRASQAAMDRSAIQTEQYSLGIKTYYNPSTGQTFNASNQYNYTYQRASDGLIVQTNDPTINPSDYDRAGEVYNPVTSVP